METDRALYIHRVETHDEDASKSYITKDLAKADSTVENPIKYPADLVNLARSSTFLSSRMYNLASSCGHAPTRGQIEDVAGELATVSTVLYRLGEAMLGQPDRCTSEFKHDLGRNNAELGLYLDEISECAEELHRNDPLGADHIVPWFFKKGRVTRLIKHLQLLKGQLSIMRLVLKEGSEFLVTDEGQREPHPLTEARVTLEAALAKNQNAIEEVLQYEDAMRQKSLMASKKADSSAAKEEVTSLREVSLAASSTDPFVDEPAPAGLHITSLNRRFTKRAREGNHIPILSIGNSPARLMSKWIKPRASDGNSLTALPEGESSIISTPINSAPDIIRPVPIRPSQDTITSVNKAVVKIQQDKTKSESRWDRFKRHTAKLNVLKAQGLVEEQNSGGSERRMSSCREKTGALDDHDSPSRVAQVDTSTANLRSSRAAFWQEIQTASTYPFKLVAAGFSKHKVSRKD